MNQAELIAAVSDKLDIAKNDVERILKTVGEVTHEALSTGDEVVLPNIGKLKTKQMAARTGRNPKTGEELHIPAKTKPVFVAAKALKAAI